MLETSWVGYEMSVWSYYIVLAYNFLWAFYETTTTYIT